MKSLYSTALLVAVMCVMYGGMVIGAIYIANHSDHPSIFSHSWRGL